MMEKFCENLNVTTACPYPALEITLDDDDDDDDDVGVVAALVTVVPEAEDDDDDEGDENEAGSVE